VPYKDRKNQRENSRKYYEENKEKKQEYNREWYKANKEKRREYNREYREANKERIQEYKREWYKANKERLQERRDANKEKKQEYNREYLKTNVEMSMWHSCKKRAKKGNLPFDLTIEDLEVPEKCPILGLELKAGNDSSREISPSLDRIVPELGYVKGNIRVISLRANRLKSDASIEELEAILKYMKEHERDSI
jgi:hypothetical protein